MESDGSCNLTIWRMEMEGTPKGIHTPEFRAEAVKLVESTGMSIARAAKQLSMPKSSLDNWVRSAREGKPAEAVPSWPRRFSQRSEQTGAFPLLDDCPE